MPAIKVEKAKYIICPWRKFKVYLILNKAKKYAKANIRCSKGNTKKQNMNGLICNMLKD